MRCTERIIYLFVGVLWLWLRCAVGAVLCCGVAVVWKKYVIQTIIHVYSHSQSLTHTHTHTHTHRSACARVSGTAANV